MPTRITAWVVLSEPVPDDDLFEHVPLLLPYKHPQDIHVVDTLPRNSLGKIQKRHLHPKIAGSAPAS